MDFLHRPAIKRFAYSQSLSFVVGSCPVLWATLRDYFAAIEISSKATIVTIHTLHYYHMVFCSLNLLNFASATLTRILLTFKKSEAAYRDQQMLQTLHFSINYAVLPESSATPSVTPIICRLNVYDY
jgi:hypothetical protein